MTPPTLPLHEEVLLLALRDESGTLHSGAWVQSALGGAILGELLLAGHVGAAREGEHDVVHVEDGPPPENELLDDCLRAIRESQRRYPPAHWAGIFSSRSDVLNRTAASLCRRGVLRMDEQKVLLLFTRKVYPEVDPAPEAELLERLRQAIFEDDTVVEPRTRVLVAVADRTGLLKANFDPKDLARRSERIEGIARGDYAGDATSAAIQAAQNAFFFLVIMPAVIPTVIT